MEFDKSKVYTALNADELEIGSKVIVADNLEDLKYWVVNYTIPKTLIKVDGEDTQYRFEAGGDKYALAYLVSEPGKLKWTDLKVGDVIRKGTQETMVITTDSEGDCHVLAGGVWFNDKDLEEWEKVENDND